MSHNLRRDLGVVESYAALLGILIGAGIFKVTGVAWEMTGPSVVLGYLVLAPAILATSVAYSVFVSTPLGREPGGEYTHISRVFGGYGLAFVGAWLKIISYIGALAYLARAFGDYVRQLFGGRGDVVVIAVGSLLFFYVIHVAGGEERPVVAHADGEEPRHDEDDEGDAEDDAHPDLDRKSTRLNSSHGYISYAV